MPSCVSTQAITHATRDGATHARRRDTGLDTRSSRRPTRRTTCARSRARTTHGPRARAMPLTTAGRGEVGEQAGLRGLSPVSCAPANPRGAGGPSCQTPRPRAAGKRARVGAGQCRLPRRVETHLRDILEAGLDECDTDLRLRRQRTRITDPQMPVRSAVEPSKSPSPWLP